MVYTRYPSFHPTLIFHFNVQSVSKLIVRAVSVTLVLKDLHTAQITAGGIIGKHNFIFLFVFILATSLIMHLNPEDMTPLGRSNQLFLCDQLWDGNMRLLFE